MAELDALTVDADEITCSCGQTWEGRFHEAAYRHAYIFHRAAVTAPDTIPEEWL